MPRVVRQTVQHDTSLFDPRQLTPNVLLRFTMSGWAAWLEEHLVPFPALIDEHRMGVVVAGFRIDYPRSHGFFDGSGFDVETRVTRFGHGRFLRLTVDVTPPGVDTVATVELALSTVIVRGGRDDMAAKPGLIPEPIRDRFEEGPASNPGKQVKGLVDALGWQPDTPTDPFEMTLKRQHCEMADQWCYLEIPCLTSDAREAWVERSGKFYESRAMARRSITARLRAPAFIYDPIAIDTHPFQTEPGLTFVHQLRRVGAGGESLGVLVEELVH
jgi:hypothetical protein